MHLVHFSLVQSLSYVQLSATPWTAACQASLSITNSRSLLKLMCIESMMPSIDLILCHPLLLPPSVLASITVFSSESLLCIRWPKYWSFSFSISPSNEYSGRISFRIDWFDLLAVQGTLVSNKREVSVSLESALSKYTHNEVFNSACVHAKSLQSCLTLCDLIYCSPLGFSVNGILQARILESVLPSSRASSGPTD